MHSCEYKPKARADSGQLAISLDEFRYQYVGRVLEIMGHDFEKAASALGVPDRDLKALISVQEN